MSRKPISSINFSKEINLSECHPDSECRTVNWWLYDTRAGMNIGMREKTRDEAFVKAINYWAKRSNKYEKAYADLKTRVDNFVNQFKEPEDLP